MFIIPLEKEFIILYLCKLFLIQFIFIIDENSNSDIFSVIYKLFYKSCGN